MEKVNFAMPMSEEQKEIKDACFAEIMADAHVTSFMKQNHVDKTYIYNHCGKISDWVTRCHICEKCAGIDFCRMPLKGHMCDLHVENGFLIEEVRCCRYQQKVNSLYMHRKNFISYDAKEDYLLISMDYFEPSKESVDYMLAVDKAVDFISKPEKGLYLYGQPGVGKTYLMAGITNELAKKGRKIAFVNVPKYIAELKMLFQDNEAFERKVRSLKQVDILVLDDIGGESVTGWSRDEILLPLLDERMEKGKVTLFTSNYSWKELKARLTVTSNALQEPMAAKRLLDRIEALSCEVFIKGSSRRK